MKKKIRQCGLIISDIISIYFAIFISLFVRYDGNIPIQFLKMALFHGLYISVIFVIMFFVFELYKSLWEYIGVKELFMIICACICGTILSVMVELLFVERLPLAVFVSALIIIILFVGGIRISFKLIRKIYKIKYSKTLKKTCKIKRVLIVGAGDACSTIIREIRSNPNIQCLPVAVVDDDNNKQGKKILGIPIVGDMQTIPKCVKQYNIDQIIFAIPSANGVVKKEILRTCAQTRCNIQIMASMSKLFSNQRLGDLLRPVMIKDLLGREEIELNIPSIASYLKKKTVLITGGGGSIGSEIARQVMNFNIKRLVVLDIYENNAYELLNELRILYGNDIDVNIVIASIRDYKRLNNIFLMYKPDVVFHAAAYKHVPLMETSPCEAINNNILGTLKLVKISDQCKVKKFIFISTDKAVNPTNIMGATKRVTEMLIQSMDKHSNTEFAAVRFGNVLGSNGSVIPIFKKQIEAGGPITLTHPDIKRYFMTMPEAAQLVIQAGALANGGEIFILDMGEPVKIMELAKNMIILSGLRPEIDIKIKIIGLRPGEKLFEELFLDDNGVEKTKHKKIYVEKPNDILFEEVIGNIELLVESIDDTDTIREVMAKIVPTYKFNRDIT